MKHGKDQKLSNTADKAVIGKLSNRSNRGKPITKPVKIYEDNSNHVTMEQTENEIRAVKNHLQNTYPKLDRTNK